MHLLRRSLPAIHRIITRAMASGSDRAANRLIDEKSPYLLQHSYNPVKWYPWGQEAFDKAKSEHKMIFLSIGYSTCHWCHVMERESFESADIGEVMNEHYVSIKVDREERPDVDRVYMTFVQATTGGGGWPLSIWLTPDLKPVVGGTYFPPEDRYYGRPGFKTVLLDIAEKWREHGDKVEEQGSAVLNALLKYANLRTEASTDLPNGSASFNQCFSMLKNSYDSLKGGFSKAPKFPQPVNLNFLLRYQLYANDRTSEEALNMVKFTLEKMAMGGIHDHVSKGFHRYSTDDRWHVPHFEKMLYDQAQLAVAYAETYQICKEQLYADVAHDILEYVSRDLSHPDGGFFSAEDADSFPTIGAEEKKEGAFCVWTYDEIYKLLDKRIDGDKNLADLFSVYYGVKKDGNVDPLQDPHDELKHQNVLIVERGIDDVARQFGLEKSKAETLLAEAREILYNERLKRPKASLDDKILTAWNGLMISGYSKCAQVFSEKKYADRAIAAAEFIYKNMYDQSKKTLLRTAYTDSDRNITQIDQPIDGFVDDYAYLIRGLIDLYEACYDEKYLEWAEELQNTQNALFWDEQNHGYFNTSTKDASIVLRLKEDQDGAEPSANSVSSSNLLRLSHYLNNEDYGEKALSIFKHFSQRLLQIPVALPEMVNSLMYHHSSPKQVIIIGDKNKADTRALIQRVHDKFLPGKILIVAGARSRGFLSRKLSILNDMIELDGKATAYVCKNYACQLPVNSPEELEKLL